MRRLMLTAAIAALTLPTAALADKGGHGKGGKHGGHEKHAAVHAARGHDRHEGDTGRRLGHERRAWARGDRLPTVYLAPRYYVQDYRRYELVAPPRGMVWVQPYEDARRFYLVQAATGLITQILGR